MGYYPRLKDLREDRDLPVRRLAEAEFENLVFISKTNHPLHESNIRMAVLYFSGVQ